MTDGGGLACAEGGARKEGVKRTIKAVVFTVLTLVEAPLFLCYVVARPIWGRDNAFRDAMECLAVVPGLLGRYLRVTFLRVASDYCHPSVGVGFGTIFTKAGVVLKEGTNIGSYCQIGLATFEKDALLSSGIYVASGALQHGIADVTLPISQQPGVDQRVTIGEGCWVGIRSVVMADVGKGAVVAAGAVVTKPIPDFAIAGGVPARVLKSRLPEQAPSA